MSKDSSAGYYQEKACEKYQDFSVEEKEKKQEWDCERYTNLSEEEKGKKR